MNRGSKKHILDWTDRPEFCAELLQLAQPINVHISAPSLWMPQGYGSPQEARLESAGSGFLQDATTRQALRAWWLVQNGNTPNWDIAARCEIGGKPGLVLVEAKAHVQELKSDGKKCGPSEGSQANHKQIKKAIQEACAALCDTDPQSCISCDSCYQLANRLAFAWKLASLGIPTVLMYLGFIGDNGISNGGEPFRDETHWERIFAEYAHKTAPEALFEREIDCGAASTWFLVRSREVLTQSPPGMTGLQP